MLIKFLVTLSKKKKIERLNKCLLYISINKHKSRLPWITNSIIKSIKYKNKLFIKMKINPDLKLTYNNYRNRLCKIICLAKQLFQKIF